MDERRLLPHNHAAGRSLLLRDLRDSKIHPSNLRIHRHARVQTPEEDDRLARVEALDYVQPENESYRREVAQMTAAKERMDGLARWMLTITIGFLVGLTAFFVHYLIKKISSWKFDTSEEFYIAGNLQAGFLSYLTFNIVLGFLASAIIVFFEPNAGGSGVPEVKGYLNGARIPKALNMSVLVAKVTSAIFAVSSSLPVGPEGPMIHAGSMIGGGVGSVRSKTLKFDPKCMRQFRTPRDRRGYISQGAAAGVSAAFGAPIGGILFAIEEASSFWSPRLTWRTFFGCMIATFTNNFFLSNMTGRFDKRSTVIFEIGISSSTSSYHIGEILPIIILGVIGGLLGAFFTWGSLKINRWRRDFINRFRFVRVMEVLLLVIVSSLFFGLFPRAFSCRELFETPETFETLAAEGTYENVRFDCQPEEYNPFATLAFTTQEHAIRRLFAIGIPDAFPLSVLFSFGALYFFLSFLTAGSAISSGLIVPILITGGCYGRFFGVLLHQFFPKIDPGIYALVGASSFLGGVTRMTVSMTIILLEITDVLNFLLPIMLSLMVGKWVGDFFTHPLYDALLEIKCIPYLEQDPPVISSLMTCRDVMSSPVVVFSVKARVRDIVSTLSDPSHGHNGFPIIEDVVDALGRPRKVLRGLITRVYLFCLLRERVFTTRYIHSTSDFQNLVDTAPKQKLGEFRGRIVPVEVRDRYFREYCEKLALSDSDLDMDLDISTYMNAAPITVFEDSGVEMAFRLFRTMELRHMPVINMHNEVCGIISRKDFTEGSLENAFARVVKRMRAKDEAYRANEIEDIDFSS